MPRTRQPIKRQSLKTFFPLMDGELRRCRPEEEFGITPKDYQELLHSKASYLRERYGMLVKVRSQIEDGTIFFLVIVDGD